MARPSKDMSFRMFHFSRGHATMTLILLPVRNTLTWMFRHHSLSPLSKQRFLPGPSFLPIFLRISSPFKARVSFLTSSYTVHEELNVSELTSAVEDPLILVLSPASPVAPRLCSHVLTRLLPHLPESAKGGILDADLALVKFLPRCSHLFALLSYSLGNSIFVAAEYLGEGSSTSASSGP
jgi:hypothetical protein